MLSTSDKVGITSYGTLKCDSNCNKLLRMTMGGDNIVFFCPTVPKKP